MKLTAAQTKGRIKNIALKNGADPRVLMRIYMMERFLERISLSQYKENFIIKGGMLITSMIGISLRSTMDIDTTIKGQKLNLENAQRIMSEIVKVPVEDDIVFTVNDVEMIMDDMEYSGIRFHIDAKLEKMITPIKIDLSAGDAITPREIEYNYSLILEDRKIELWSYNLETIFAEKLQTILVRERANTRMRDYYDICVLMEMYKNEINEENFYKAYDAMCKKRETLHLIGNENKIIDIIEDDSKLSIQWKKYQDKYSYAENYCFEKTIMCVRKLVSILDKKRK